MTKILFGFVVALALVLPQAAHGAAPANPNYSVTLEPDGAPIGVAIAVHGGGWVGSTDYVDDTVPLAAPMVEAGYRVKVVGYRTGGYESFQDVVRWFDRVRAATSLPVCVMGWSAGAHLTLMLAAYRNVKCAVSVAGPTDLTKLTGLARLLAEDAFGADEQQLRYASPMTYPSPRATMLLGHAEADSLVSWRQSTSYANKTGAEVHVLPPGDVPFTHAKVDSSAYAHWRARLIDFLHDFAVAPAARTAAADNESPASEPPSELVALVECGRDKHRLERRKGQLQQARRHLRRLRRQEVRHRRVRHARRQVERKRRQVRHARRVSRRCSAA